MKITRDFVVNYVSINYAEKQESSVKIGAYEPGDDGSETSLNCRAAEKLLATVGLPSFEKLSGLHLHCELTSELLTAPSLKHPFVLTAFSIIKTQGFAFEENKISQKKTSRYSIGLTTSSMTMEKEEGSSIRISKIHRSF